ncbi:hypothetical protein HOD61_01960 [archaeon]|nr:hypothetical protein [archaeon]
MNKNGTTVMLRTVNILLIGVLLLAYVLIMSLGDFKSADVEEKLLLEREIGYSIENLNLLNYLRTPIEYDLDGDGIIESTTIAVLTEKYYLSDNDDLGDFLRKSTFEIFKNLNYCNEINDLNYIRGYKISIGSQPNEEGDVKLIEINSVCTYPVGPAFDDMCLEGSILQQKLKTDLYVSLINTDIRFIGDCFEW